MSPIWVLITTTIIVPVVLTCIWSFTAIWQLPRKIWDLHIFCLGLCGAMAFQFLMVVVLKNSTGKPRPDLLARCQPWSLSFPPAGTLANIVICTNTDLKVLWDGFRSFPSGHASSGYFLLINTQFLTWIAAFTSAIYQVLYHLGRFRIMDGQGIGWRVILSFLPMMSAMYATFTGISDNRNFLEDALCGAFLGSMVASVFYSVYFPSIFNITNSGRAYPPRRVGFSFLLGPLANFLPLDETPKKPLRECLPGGSKYKIQKKDCQHVCDDPSQCISHKCHRNCVEPSTCGKQECLHKCGDSAKCVSHECHRTCSDSSTCVNHECHRHCIDPLRCVREIWKHHIARKQQSTNHDCHHKCGDPVKCLSHECHRTCSDSSICVNYECHRHCIDPLRCVRGIWKRLSKKGHDCHHSCGDPAKCVSKECHHTCADKSTCINHECHRHCIDPLRCVREIWKRMSKKRHDCHHSCGDAECVSKECHHTCEDSSTCVNHECHRHCIDPLKCVREIWKVMSKKHHACHHSCGDAKCVSKECHRTCADSSKCVNHECHRLCIDPLKCVREIWKHHVSMKQHSVPPVHVPPQAHHSHRYSQKSHHMSSPRQYESMPRSSYFEKKFPEPPSILVPQKYPGAPKPDLLSFSAPGTPIIDARERSLISRYDEPEPRSLTNRYDELKNLSLNNRYEETKDVTVTDRFEETQKRTLNNRYDDSLTTVE